MQAHEKRVVDEHTTLTEKSDALLAFFDTTVFGGLPDQDKSLLRQQWGLMKAYADVLATRIARFSRAYAD